MSRKPSIHMTGKMQGTDCVLISICLATRFAAWHSLPASMWFWVLLADCRQTLIARRVPWGAIWSDFQWQWSFILMTSVHGLVTAKCSTLKLPFLLLHQAFCRRMQDFEQHASIFLVPLL